MLWLAANAGAQACPRQDPSGPLIDSGPVTLTGKVVYHNDLRHWVSLRLAASVCGAREVQLLGSVGGAYELGKADSSDLVGFRGCKARITGTLGLPGTGYYSAPLYLNVAGIAAEASCQKKTSMPDYSGTKPSPDLHNYRVSMWIDRSVEPGGHLTGAAFSRGHRLTPWQAYADYFLTGSMAFMANCADGFRIGRVWGSPSAHPQHLFQPGDDGDRAVIDIFNPTTRRTKLSFTCLLETES